MEEQSRLRNRKSGVLRKAHVLKLSKKSLYRHLTVVGEARGIEDIREEIDKIAPGDELLTASEVAKILKCSRSSVYRWATEEGRIPFIMVFGTSFRIRRSDLNKVLQEALKGIPDADLC